MANLSITNPRTKNYATVAQLATKANASAYAAGTIGSSLTLPALTYSIATAVTTASTVAAITLPSATNGQSFELYVTNPSTGTVGTPTFSPASSQALVWMSPLIWVTAASAVNVIRYDCPADGTWRAYPLTSGAGVPAPLQEQLLHVSPAGATQTIPSPLASPYYTVAHYTLSANLTLTMPTISTNGGENFSLWIDQPASSTYTVTFSGTIRWLGNAAPTAPAALQRLWVTFIADNSTSQWIGSVVSAGF